MLVELKVVQLDGKKVAMKVCHLAEQMVDKRVDM